jgi:hypothetical protein
MILDPLSPHLTFPLTPCFPSYSPSRPYDSLLSSFTCCVKEAEVTVAWMHLKHRCVTTTTTIIIIYPIPYHFSETRQATPQLCSSASSYAN